MKIITIAQATLITIEYANAAQPRTHKMIISNAPAFGTSTVVSRCHQASAWLPSRHDAKNHKSMHEHQRHAPTLARAFPCDLSSPVPSLVPVSPSPSTMPAHPRPSTHLFLTHAPSLPKPYDLHILPGASWSDPTPEKTQHHFFHNDCGCRGRGGGAWASCNFASPRQEILRFIRILHGFEKGLEY